MDSILKQISKLAIQSNGGAFNDEQKTLEWLGNASISVGEINALESRLGIELPDDYKKFLLITNGFFTPCDSTEPTFENAEKVDFFKNIDPLLLSIWNEGVLVDIGQQLTRAIVIAGINDEQYFLLIPPNGSNSEWKYWKFAHWIPGEAPYQNLEEYFQNVLDFMKKS